MLVDKHGSEDEHFELCAPAGAYMSRSMQLHYIPVTAFS